jgi:Fe-S cluster assembly protein SufD
MTQATAHSGALDRVLRDYRAVQAQLPDTVIPQALRSRAALEFSRLGWPRVSDEQWRYANIRAFERVADFRPATDSAMAALGIELPAPIPRFQRLLYIDGQRHGDNDPVADALPGATAAPLWPAEQRLGLLCDMFARDSASLRIEGEAAIEILFVCSARDSAAVYPRLQVELRPGSRLRLIERHLGDPAAARLVGANVTLALQADAHLQHYRLQQYGGQIAFSDTLSASLEAGATYSAHQVSIGAGTARTSAQVQLRGRGASLNWQEIAVGRAEQVHDTSLKVEHRAPETRTEEAFRGIADERARIAFSGHIQIDASAPGSDTRQSLRGLIEGAGAEIDLRPRLEINTDEVRAQHGATTGRLDENLMFYLLSRGLDRRTAQALLKWAFLGDVLRSIELPELRSAAEHGAAGQLRETVDFGVLA